MSQKRTQLSNMIATSLDSFQTALTESKDPIKLIRHNGKGMEKEAVAELINDMVVSVQHLVRQKMDEVIDQNKLDERFAELDKLTEESELLNQKLNRPAGYHFIKPKRDIAMHMSSTTERLNLDLDDELAQLENDISKEDAELKRLEEVFFELASVVKLQQENITA